MTVSVATKSTRRPKGQKTRVAVDWEAVEKDYRAGLLSVREIGASRGASHTAIQKRAAKFGWERDLQAKIKAKADALVAKAEVATQVATEKAATDQTIIEANAEVIKQIRLAHRKDIARARKMAMQLLEELEHTGEHMGLLAELDKMVSVSDGLDPKEAEKRAALLQKVLELPARTGVMKALAETMTKLIALEREAYSLETKNPGGDDNASGQLRALLNDIDGAGTGLPGHAGPAH